VSCCSMAHDITVGDVRSGLVSCCSRAREYHVAAGKTEKHRGSLQNWFLARLGHTNVTPGPQDAFEARLILWSLWEETVGDEASHAAFYPSTGYGGQGPPRVLDEGLTEQLFPRRNRRTRN
jgi:hypothetical protein